MIGILVMIKTALIKQLRSYRFLVVVAMSIAVAWFFVPTSQENYNIFVIGGKMRGLYNSAYLGIVASLAASIVLFLAGFFLLRSQISEDRNLRIGQIIAAKPVSKLWYVGSKAVSNLVILLLWEIVNLFSIAVVQLIRAEDTHISIWGYIQPFLEITLPLLIVLAALTVLFDTLPLVQGVFGNILFFALWNLLFIVPSELQSQPIFDLFGLNRITHSLSMEAIAAHPELSSEALEDVSFGINYFSGVSSNFAWHGLPPDGDFLSTRLIWVGAALALTLIAALTFDRFSKNKIPLSSIVKKKKSDGTYSEKTYSGSLQLSSVSRDKSGNLLAIIKGELRIMLSNLSLIQLILILAGIGLNLFLPTEYIGSWISLFLVLPVSVLSEMGCRDYHCRTSHFVICRCDLRDKWLSEMLSGLLIIIMVSSGAILRGIFAGELLQTVSYIVGIFFIVSLALTLGTLTRSRRMFEALYIIWLYMGPFQQIPALNFISNSADIISIYALIGIVLAVIGYILVSLKEKFSLGGLK